MPNFCQNPEAFRIQRSQTPTIERGEFTKLLMALTKEVSRNLGMHYSNTAVQLGHWWTERRDETDVEVERVGFTRTADGRMVDARLFPEGMPIYAEVGVVAMVGVSPTPKDRVEKLYVMSTIGDDFWVTEYDEGSPIESTELESLVQDLESV